MNGVTMRITHHVLNDGTLSVAQRALTHGLLALAQQIAEEASATVEVATDPRHIRDLWGAAAYDNGREIGSASADGSSVDKPDGFRDSGGLTAVVGFDEPARFHEMGTAHSPAEPFLSPTVQRLASRAPQIIRDGAQSYWPK